MKISYIQFLPKKEEVENSEVKYLAKRLKGKNDAETLTNILEWEDRNLRFWDDRWLMPIIVPIIVFVPIFSLISLLFLSGPNILSVSIVSLLLCLVMVSFQSGKLLERVLIPLLFPFFISLFVIVMIALQMKIIPSRLLVFSIITSLSLGFSVSILLYLGKKYKRIKQNIPEFGIDDIFTLSLPLTKILQYKLAVCRDYAKLTMALLLNLYPNSELYFVEIPRHVAVAVRLDKTTYVLDQHLPILSLKKWVLFWRNRLKKRKLEPRLSLVKKNDDIKIVKTEKFKDHQLQREVNSILSKMILTEITNNLKRELVNRTSVRYSEFRLVLCKNFITLLENDEIVKYSLQRFVKRKIEDELCSRVQDIIDMNLQTRNNNLSLRVKLKGEKSE
jgi:predicted transglutaminase-like protease